MIGENKQGYLDSQELQSFIVDSMDQLNDFDTWILLKLNHMIEEVEYFMQRHNYIAALRVIMQHTRYDFCDCYMEVNKKETGNASCAILMWGIRIVCSLLYPFMPLMVSQLWKLI